MGAVLTLALSPAWAQSAEAPLLRWTELFRQPIGPKGLEWTPALRAAHGHTVRLVGYMVQQDVPTPGLFLLTPRPVQMSEEADGQADDLPAATVAVRLHESQQGWRVPHVAGLVALQGVLTLERQELADGAAAGRVFWLHLQLPADALREPPPASSATALSP